MRMLRWMSENTKGDKMQNEVICSYVRVAFSEEKIRENGLRWFVYVPVRICGKR
jgi:hypothetical protein